MQALPAREVWVQALPATACSRRIQQVVMTLYKFFKIILCSFDVLYLLIPGDLTFDRE